MIITVDSRWRLRVFVERSRSSIDGSEIFNQLRLVVYPVDSHCLIRFIHTVTSGCRCWGLPVLPVCNRTC